MLALGLLFCSLTFLVARPLQRRGRPGARRCSAGPACAARSRASPAPCSSRSGSGSPPTRADVARVLLAYSNFARFVRIDRDLLAERHEVEEYAQPGVVPRPLEVVRKVRRADVLVVWFASWHALLPLLVARLLRTPSLLIVGGFDTASMPEIGYGYQQGGIRRRLARACMRLATRLMTNSEYSRGELLRTAGFEATVVHHGVPDPFGALPEGPRDRRRRHRLERGPHRARAEGATRVRRGGRARARRRAPPRRRVDGRRRRRAPRARAAERPAHGPALRRGSRRRCCAGRPCTCRPRGTRASGWASPRRCSPGASRS